MKEIFVYLIGVVVLILGAPIGDFLAKKTQEELKPGQFWFKTIIIVSLICSAIAAIISNDGFFFAFLFIAIVTSRSLLK